jgi:DNA-binding transcriptional LysR family regulator
MRNLVGMAIFARVVEANSFSGAAARLGVSKAVVSKHVAKLEHTLGTQLLNRTTRRLSLTDAGHTFFGYCARIMNDAEAAELAVSRLRVTPRGLLKITTPVAFGSLHIAPALPEFLRRYPDMSVQLVMDDRVIDLAREGYDVAVRMAREPAPNTVARQLAVIRWAVCGAPEYLQRHGTPAAPRDLANHNCLVYSLVEGGTIWRFRSSRGETRVRVTGNLTAGSSLALREAVLRGSGIAQLPTFTVGPDIHAGVLKVLLPGYEPFGTFGGTIYAVHLPTRHLSPKMRAFVDFFVERFSPEPYWDALIRRS